MLKDLEKGNWIIPPWDKRYGKLGHIMNKYRWNDDKSKGYIGYELVCYTDTRSIFYYIPPELVIKDYITKYVKVLKNPGENSDTNWNNWIGHNFDRILTETTGLSKEDYYLLFIDKTNSRQDIHRCLTCCDKIHLRRLLEGYSYFCSHYCESQYKLKHSEIYFNFNHVHNDIYLSVKLDCYRFIGFGEPNDVCYLYHAITESGRFKFGITKNMGSRLYHSYSHADPYNSMEDTPDYVGSRLNTAYLEASIKLHFGGREYLDISEKEEYFKVLNQLLEKPIQNPFD